MDNNESRFSTEEKQWIAQEIIKMMGVSGLESQAKFAARIGFGKSDISNLKTGAWVKNQALFSEQKWVRLAQIAGYHKDTEIVLVEAHTQTFDYLTTQLTMCQNGSTYAMMCDAAGIGKTYACKRYAASHTNVMYINCSACPGKNKFKRAFAAAAGIVPGGHIDEAFEAAIIYIGTANKPLIILDEAGDLKDEVFCVIKRIYNDLEDVCGIFMLGAVGLKRKIERGMGLDKPGFEEVFSRFGRDYGRYTPDPRLKDASEYEEYMQQEMCTVLMANGMDIRSARETASKMRSRDLRAVKRAIKATRLMSAM